MFDVLSRSASKGGESMESSWVMPDFEEIGVNAECTAYASAR
jgi:hypothetical protein